MAIKPTLKQLKYLCTVADTLHFGNAARACHVTQSTLSAGIHELEQSLGVALLERSNKSVMITATGEQVVARARHILADVEALVEQAAQSLEPFSNRIRLGVIPTIAPFVLPETLQRLRQDYPRLQLLIREDLSENLVNLLQMGELDLILLALPYPMTNVTIEHLFEDPFLLACPKQHPLGKIENLKTKDLKGHDILLLEQGHCLRDHALEACKLIDRQVSLSFEATSLHTIVPMVASGIGVTLLPQMAVDTGILSGFGNIDTKPFSEKKVLRSIDLAWRKNSPREKEYRLLARYFARRPSADNPSAPARKQTTPGHG